MLNFKIRNGILSGILSGILILSFVFTLSACRNDLASKKCVAMVGDSVFALTGEEPKYLESLAGESYRHYYKSGAQMVGGSIKTVPVQYDDAISAGSIRTLILNGGGNDVLIGGRAVCSVEPGRVLRPKCYEVLNQVITATSNMLEKSIGQGVENIVYQGYYFVTDTTLWGIVDVFAEEIEAMMSDLRAQYPDVSFVLVDPREAFDGNDYIIFDGIHPNRKGSFALANLVWDAMVENDIEQDIACD